MNYFTYKDNRLFAEDVALSDLATRLGTPLYIYSARTLRRHYRVLSEAFKDTDRLICFAMKALSNLSILKLFSDLGAGFDIVSVGELMRCVRVGADPGKIVFSGVGKTDEEIEAALKAKILMINVESRPELHRVSAVAQRIKLQAPVSLRVPLIVVGSLLSLSILGALAARAGGAAPVKGALRVSLWSALAMGLTIAIGSALGSLS